MTIYNVKKKIRISKLDSAGQSVEVFADDKYVAVDTDKGVVKVPTSKFAKYSDLQAEANTRYNYNNQLALAIGTKADASSVYTKSQVNDLADTKADKSTTYTKTETDSALALKADKSTTYTKTEVDTISSNDKQYIAPSKPKNSASVDDVFYASDDGGKLKRAFQFDESTILIGDTTIAAELKKKVEDVPNDGAFYVRGRNGWVKYADATDEFLSNYPINYTTNYAILGSFNGSIYGKVLVNVQGSVTIGLWNVSRLEYDKEVTLTDAQTTLTLSNRNVKYELHAKGNGFITATAKN